MSGTDKFAVYILVLAMSVSAIAMADQPGHRTERSLTGQYSQSEVDAELAAPLQWLREKTAQVGLHLLCHHGNSEPSSSSAP